MSCQCFLSGPVLITVAQRGQTRSSIRTLRLKSCFGNEYRHHCTLRRRHRFCGTYYSTSSHLFPRMIVTDCRNYSARCRPSRPRILPLRRHFRHFFRPNDSLAGNRMVCWRVEVPITISLRESNGHKALIMGKRVRSLVLLEGTYFSTVKVKSEVKSCDRYSLSYMKQTLLEGENIRKRSDIQIFVNRCPGTVSPTYHFCNSASKWAKRDTPMVINTIR